MKQNHILVSALTTYLDEKTYLPVDNPNQYVHHSIICNAKSLHTHAYYATKSSDKLACLFTVRNLNNEIILQTNFKKVHGSPI